jgi:16S rRNA (adenine1518-N6/adenine1519-N6)-dimethyltransferase
MTKGLLERRAIVKAFEIDPGFIRVLKTIFGGNPRFTMVEGDVLKTWRHTGGGSYMLGNLPYNIGARLLATFIEENRFFKRMVVTVQREVAQRMIASPGSKDYSSFSVLCTSVYTISPLMVLKGASFYPAPHVDSQGVRLDLRTDADPRAYPSCFRPLVRHLFASRRKTVKNNLQSFIVSQGGSVNSTLETLERCGIQEHRRAETLALEDFIALAKQVDSFQQTVRNKCPIPRPHASPLGV